MTIITEVTAVDGGAAGQMGVQVALTGMRDWGSYLEREVDDNNID